MNNIPKTSEWLPIRYFDNLKYQTLLPEEWIALYKDENNELLQITAKALIKNESNGIYMWKDVEVIRPESEKQKWIVRT